VEWQAAEKLAQKREQENATSENPALRHSFSERHNHEIKMAIFRKDSSLSNDVFESLDAPCSGTLDETCRPETVVEESSCVTSPTTEPPVSSMEVECREVIESLPVKAGMINLYLQSLILFFICLGLTLRTTWLFNGLQRSLPPPKEGGYVFACVCLSVRPLDYWKSYEQILMKFFGGMGRGARNNSLDSGGDF